MQNNNGATTELVGESAPANLQSLNANPSIDLNEPGQRKLLARRIKEDIDRYCADAYDDGPRSHLGASLIGHECSRHLWYTFRWIKHKKHTGRQQRLFNRGHREEARFIEWLRGIGFQVWEYEISLWYSSQLNFYFIASSQMKILQPEIEICGNKVDLNLCFDVTNEPSHVEAAKQRNVIFDKGKSQFRVKAVRGHFGGSLDGICRYPEGYDINDAMLLEFKTSGTGSKFTNLIKNGVKLEKPQHFAQMSMYGKHYGFKFALYMAINKNDDDLYVEVVELDWTLGERLETKADLIINSQTPPPKIAQSSAYLECKWCDHLGVCHGDDLPSKNCRSCANALPADNAEWFCKTHNAIIPKASLLGVYECWQDITKGV